MRNPNILLILMLPLVIFSSIAQSNSDVTFKLVGSNNASAGILSTDVQIGFEMLFNGYFIYEIKMAVLIFGESIIGHSETAFGIFPESAERQ